MFCNISVLIEFYLLYLLFDTLYFILFSVTLILLKFACQRMENVSSCKFIRILTPDLFLLFSLMTVMWKSWDLLHIYIIPISLPKHYIYLHTQTYTSLHTYNSPLPPASTQHNRPSGEPFIILERETILRLRGDGSQVWRRTPLEIEHLLPFFLRVPVPDSASSSCRCSSAHPSYRYPRTPHPSTRPSFTQQPAYPSPSNPRTPHSATRAPLTPLPVHPSPRYHS